MSVVQGNPVSEKRKVSNALTGFNSQSNSTMPDLFMLMMDEVSFRQQTVISHASDNAVVTIIDNRVK